MYDPKDYNDKDGKLLVKTQNHAATVFNNVDLYMKQYTSCIADGHK